MKCYCTFSLDNILPKLLSNVFTCMYYARPNNTLLLCGYDAKCYTAVYYLVSTEGFHLAFKSTKSIFYQTLMNLV